MKSIEALRAKATPGTWRAIDKPTSARVQAGRSVAVAACRAKYRDASSIAVAHANAALIVAAVNAMPAMIAYVRELERERDEARDGWHMANGVADLAMKHRDSAEAERDALREVVRAADAMEPYAAYGYVEYRRARAKVTL